MQQLSTFVIAHWELFLALVIILALLLTSGLSQKMLGFKEVEPQEAVRLINQQGATVLDVREEKEFHEGHIVHAISAPLENLEARLPALEDYKDKPIIIACQTGERSARAAALLRKQGFTTPYKLAGGLRAWREAKLPLSKGRL
ncbi:MAG: rhodanese-like domain-containing protein [Gammaproteobacteria bacterium]|nr:rhodanese-like domain-containing protein [Gammaproteobacteria bacterium]